MTEIRFDTDKLLAGFDKILDGFDKEELKALRENKPTLAEDIRNYKIIINRVIKCFCEAVIKEKEDILTPKPLK